MIKTTNHPCVVQVYHRFVWFLLTDTFVARLCPCVSFCVFCFIRENLSKGLINMTKIVGSGFHLPSGKRLHTY